MAVTTEAVSGTEFGETITAIVRFDGTNYFIQNVIAGNGGNDILNSLSDDSVVINGQTYDFINTLSGGDGDDVVNGGAGNDVLGGNNGIDTLNGGAGNDTLTDGT